MRIDLLKLAQHFGFDGVSELATHLPETILASLSRDKWNEFLTSCEKNIKAKPEPSLFDEPAVLPTNTVSQTVS